MRDFNCPNCGQRLAFENSLCLNCGSRLGFSLDHMALLVIASGADSEHGGAVDSSQYRLCANLHLAECNWIVEKGPVKLLCASCELTRTRPNDSDTKALAAFAAAEKAKRRLIAELYELKLPIVGRDEDPDYGLAFDLLSSEFEKVFTGHDNGVITLDLAEGDDVHREQLRVEMDEPYRTLLGPLSTRDRALLLLPAGRPVAGVLAAVPRVVRRSRRRLPGGAGPPLQRGPAARTGKRLRLVLRDHASRRGLGGDIRPLPAHPRHAGHRGGVRLRSGRCDIRAEEHWGPADSTPSSTCGCRWRGR